MADDNNVVPIEAGKKLKASDIMNNPAAASGTEPVDLIETVELETVEQFMHHLFAWHGNKMKTVLHMAAVPEGVSLEITDDATGQARDLVLTGDVHKALVLGIKMAASQFKQLPFGATIEEAPADALTEQPQPSEPSGD